MKKYRIDLHTHSKLSPDGSIEEKDYQKILQTKKLDFVAITDHNTIEYATYCQQKIGKEILVGEEISTNQGHLIGLFLTKEIAPHQDVLTTAEQIKSQGGLVYVPHAYDFFRHGIGEKHLMKILHLVDIIEIFNGRVVLPYFNKQANQFAIKYNITGGFGSDSHFSGNLGKGAMILSQQPTERLSTFFENSIDASYSSFLGYLAPKYNKMQKIFHL